MTVYVDSSIFLRLALGQKNALRAFSSFDAAITSVLAEVECLRVTDRHFQTGQTNARQLVKSRAWLFRAFSHVDRIELSASILRRASESFSTPLGTLDALHLATALLWGQSKGEMPVMATHDHQLATAAKACGLDVIGDDR